MHIISFKDPLITALNLWINGGVAYQIWYHYIHHSFSTYILETLKYIGQAKNFWAWSTSTCWIIPLSFKWDYCHYPVIFSRISAFLFKRNLMVSWNLNKSFIYPHYLGFSPVLSPLCIKCQCTLYTSALQLSSMKTAQLAASDVACFLRVG